MSYYSSLYVSTWFEFNVSPQLLIIILDPICDMSRFYFLRELYVHNNNYEIVYFATKKETMAHYHCKNETMHLESGISQMQNKT